MRYWIKLYTEIIDDPKIGRLSDNAKLMFYELLAIAGKHDNDGELPSIEDICWATRRSQEWVQSAMDELIEGGLLSANGKLSVVVNFSKRQAPIDDATRARVSRYKKLQESVESRHEDVTKRDVERKKERKNTDKKEKIEINKIPEKANSLMGVFLQKTGYQNPTDEDWQAMIELSERDVGTPAHLRSAIGMLPCGTPPVKVVAEIKKMPGWNKKEEK
jgi:hypothetical protein